MHDLGWEGFAAAQFVPVAVAVPGDSAAVKAAVAACVLVEIANGAPGMVAWTVLGRGGDAADSGVAVVSINQRQRIRLIEGHTNQ